MNKSAFYRCFESSSDELSMPWQMVKSVVLITLFSHLALWFLIFFLWLDAFEFHIFFTYIKAFFSADDHIIYFTINDSQLPLYASEVNEQLTKYVVPHAELESKFLTSMRLSFVVYIVVPLFLMYFKDQFINYNKEKWLRDAKPINAEKSKKEFKKAPKNLSLQQQKIADQVVFPAAIKAEPIRKTAPVKSDPEISKPAKDGIAPKAFQSETVEKKQESEVEIDQEKFESEKRQVIQKRNFKSDGEVADIELYGIIS
jgi:hypothetical protein